jgi:hypothetical protein
LRVRFLADANLDQDIVAGVLRRAPEVDFELPQAIIPEGVKDPEVLAVAASLGRVLVTHDVRTMPPAFRRIYHRQQLSLFDSDSEIDADGASYRGDSPDLSWLGSRRMDEPSPPAAAVSSANRGHGYRLAVGDRGPRTHRKIRPKRWLKNVNPRIFATPSKWENL